MTHIILTFINDLLLPRLDTKAADFVSKTRNDIRNIVPDARFTAFISLASRYVTRQLLAPSVEESTRAQHLLPGWDLQSWNLLEAVRVSFILSRNDLCHSDFAERYSHWFSYADEGELCAFYKAIALLPEPQPCVWRVAEGCRTNMRTVFMSVACDSPYPYQYFDDVAWNQLVVKALFTEIPLTRVYGLDHRLSTTLSSMVLDYMDERSSAGRDIPLDAWLCLGECTDLRFDSAVSVALQSPLFKQRAAAIIALGRAQRKDVLQQLLDNNTDCQMSTILQQVLNGRFKQNDFQELLLPIEG